MPAGRPITAARCGRASPPPGCAAPASGTAAPCWRGPAAGASCRGSTAKPIWEKPEPCPATFASPARSSAPSSAARTGPATLARLIALLEAAAAEGAELVVFPELALTTFFPRWWMDGADPELAGYFETAMPNPHRAAAVRPGARAADRLLPRLCRADAGGPALQHRHHRGAGRQHPRQVPQGAPAGLARVPPGAAVPAAREALLRIRRHGLPGLPRAARSGTRRCSACWSATTGAGRRPGGCWGCRGWS